jgi:RNA polymerase subunit RPABC4/transcription elongation factor Spt4
MKNFTCKKCAHLFEYLIMGEDDKPSCPECKSPEVTAEFPAPLYGVCNDPERRNAILKKRSLDDSKKHFKDNWDRERTRKPNFFPK